MGTPKQPKAQQSAPVAAAPKASALDTQLTIQEQEVRRRRKMGYNASMAAGQNGGMTVGAEVLG